MLLRTSFPNTKRNCKHYRTETMNVHMKTLNEWAKVCPGTCTFPLACYERFGERWLLCSGFTAGTSSQHRNIQCPKDSRMYLATKSKPFCWVNLLIYKQPSSASSVRKNLNMGPVEELKCYKRLSSRSSRLHEASSAKLQSPCRMWISATCSGLKMAKTLRFSGKRWKVGQRS